LIGLPGGAQEKSILSLLIEQVKIYFNTVTGSPWLIDKDLLEDQSKTHYFESVLILLRKILTPLKLSQS
jgi:hypothetical protein